VVNIVVVILIVSLHFEIIRSSGKNSIFIDVLLVCSILLLVILNIYSVYSLIRKFDKYILAALVLSVLYYMVLFFFPIIQGSR
jgi:hypothetical protein